MGSLQMIPTQIYIGKRQAMMAEIGTPHYYDGAWLVQPVGEGTWDAEGFNTLDEARKEVEYLSGVWPGVPVFWL